MMEVRKRDLYEVIEGEAIITPSGEKSIPLIEGMIYQNDYVLLTAEEKVGKTILSQHLVCALSEGKPLFGIFDIPEKCKTWYMPTEVRLDQLKERFLRISHHTGIDTSHIKLIPTKFRFNTEQGIQAMRELMARFIDDKPDLIVIDALYKAIQGSIKDDNTVNDFHYIMDWIKEELDCAILLVHHLTKPSMDKNGKRQIRRNDKDTFGSTFLGAGVDHIFRLEKWHKDPKMTKDRELVCETQRSDLISDCIRLRLCGPDPLYFRAVSVHIEEKQAVCRYLKSVEKATVDQIVGTTSVGRTIVYIVIKELLKEEQIIKHTGRPVFYSWNY